MGNDAELHDLHCAKFTSGVIYDIRSKRNKRRSGGFYFRSPVVTLFLSLLLALTLGQQSLAQTEIATATELSTTALGMEQLRNTANATRQTVIGYMAAAPAGWTQIKDEDGIKVFSRKSPDFSGKIFKVEVDSLPGSPEQIFDHAYPTNNAQRLKWDKSLKENKVIKSIEPDSVEVLYTQTAPVFFGFIEAVSARDFCDVVSIERSPDRISTASESVPCGDIMPEKADVVRGHNYPNGLTLERVAGKNETRAVQLLHTDLKGSLPQWVVEAALPGNAIDFFKTVRKHLSASGATTAK